MNRLVSKLIHELSVIDLKGELSYGERSEIFVNVTYSKKLNVVFHIKDSCNISWVLKDISGYVRNELTEGVGIYKGIDLLKGRIEHHKGMKKKLKNDRKREIVYDTPTIQQTLSKLKTFEKYYEDGYSISKAARLARVEYKTAKAYLNGELELSVN